MQLGINLAQFLLYTVRTLHYAILELARHQLREDDVDALPLPAGIPVLKFQCLTFFLFYMVMSALPV